MRDNFQGGTQDSSLPQDPQAPVKPQRLQGHSPYLTISFANWGAQNKVRRGDHVHQSHRIVFQLLGNKVCPLGDALQSPGQQWSNRSTQPVATEPWKPEQAHRALRPHRSGLWTPWVCVCIFLPCRHPLRTARVCSCSGAAQLAGVTSTAC